MTTRRSNVRRRTPAFLAALALVLGVTATTTAPAQAQDREIESGALAWGFKSSFRNYVGRQTAALPPIGPAPEGQRIVVSDGASFDPAGTPTFPQSTSNPNETLPYLFPATGGSVTDAANLVIETRGTVTYNFPSHYFVVKLSNLSVVVEDGAVRLVGDVYQNATEEFGDFPAGEYRANDVTIGALANPKVTLGADTVTVSGTGLTVHPDAAVALPQNAGEELDSFSVTATLGGQVWRPRVVVSKTSGLDPASTTTVRVTGTGFDPDANDGAGLQVVFGRFRDPWRPSAGAPASARHVIYGEHVVPAADGTFNVALDVRTDDSVPGSYGVYVYPEGVVDASHERFVAMSFESGGGGEPEPGEFGWSIDGGVAAVSLGTASVADDAFVATGTLAPIVVTDTREGGPAWRISAQVSRFESDDDRFSGKYLGWAPTLLEAGGGATAGGVVPPGLPSGKGLSTARTLGSAPRGHAPGSASLGGTLELRVPLGTPQGNYRAILTLTAVS